MEDIIYGSELEVLKILWDEGAMLAKDLANKLKETVNWKRTTSYTVIRKCIEKGLVAREKDDFVCRVLITREEAQEREARILTAKMFDGCSDSLIASLLGNSKMTTRQIELLRVVVEEFSTSSEEEN